MKGVLNMNEHSFILSEVRHDCKDFLSRCGNSGDEGPWSGPSSPELQGEWGSEAAKKVREGQRPRYLIARKDRSERRSRSNAGKPFTVRADRYAVFDNDWALGVDSQ
jgi:hypothetical protein